MGGTNELLKLVQLAAVNANEAAVPTNVVYGNVVSTTPLKIKTRENLIIPTSCLTLTRNVTDFETEVTISSSYSWKTQPRSGGGGDAEFASHDHDIVINKLKIKTHNALKVNDKVAMIKLQGGQSYLVLDRVVNT